MLLHGLVKVRYLLRIYKSSGNPQARQGDIEQVIGTPIEAVGRYYMISRTQESQEGSCQCRSSGGGHHRSYSSLYGSQALLQHIVGRVVQPGIDVARHR